MKLVSQQSGMTLIEFILVMMIIGILSVVVIPKLNIASYFATPVGGGAFVVASDIRYAQEFAMANRISKSVVLTSGASVYTFSPSSGLDPSGRLPSGVTVGATITFTFNSIGEPRRVVAVRLRSPEEE